MSNTVESNKGAPEGGWGYVVGGVMAFSLILERGLIHTYGMIFEELLLSVGGKTTELIFLLSAFVMCLSLSGLFVGFLFKRFSCRTVGILGAFLYTAGAFLTSFVTSFIFLLISFSVIQGVALGLLMTTIFTSFYQYFVKKRARMYFVFKPFVSLGAMGFPILINFLLEQYGNRGMLLILSGIYAHLFVAMMLLHPVEWHMKKTTKREVKMNTMNPNPEETQRPLLKETQRVVENDTFLLNTVTSETTQIHSNKNISSLVETENFEKVGKIKKIWFAVNNFLELELLKDLSFVNLLFGTCFVEFSETAFGALLPGYLMSIGWTMKDVALCLSTSGVGDFVCRTGLALLGFCFVLKGKQVFFMAAVLGFIFRIVFLFVGEYISVTIILTVIVFGKTITISAISLLYAEHFPIEKFPAAYGLNMIFLGITTFTMGPIIGAIKDYTGSYNITLYILIACYLVCIIPWTAEILWMKAKSRTL